MKYNNYFFDFDGTLYDTYPGMVDAFYQAFLNQGVKLDRKKVYQIMREDSVRKAYAIYTTPELDSEKLHTDYKMFEAKNRQNAKPFDGTKELLEKISSAGNKSFLLTHRDKSSLEILKKDGLLKYFTDQVTADDDFKRKPAPDSLNYLVAKYELDPKESVMVGDRSLDVLAGHNAKMAGILFDPDEMIKDDFEVEQRVTSLKQID